MLKLSTTTDNTVLLKVVGTSDKEGLSASITFGAFDKTVQLEDGKGTFDVTADEAESLETPRVYAQLDLIKDGKTVRTELVDTVKTPLPTPKRDREIVVTLVIVNAPLDDNAEQNGEGGEQNGEGGEQNGEGGDAAPTQNGQELPNGNLDNGSGEIVDGEQNGEQNGEGGEQNGEQEQPNGGDDTPSSQEQEPTNENGENVNH